MMKTLNLFYRWLLPAVFTCLITACHTSNSAHENLNGKFAIIQMGDFSRSQLEDVNAQINFQDFPASKISFGCNHIAFHSQTDATHKLELLNIRTTMMYCQDNVQNQMEQYFGDHAERVNRYQIHGDELRLLQDNNLIITAMKLTR
ncbi:MAG: META domain-containing protein [Weeksellaceae bacterium]|nr:META domain-containing protein [Weeksellaceae bacterium]